MISIDKVVKGLSSFIEKEILTIMPNDSPKKLGFALLVALIGRNPIKAINSMVDVSVLKQLDVISEDESLVDIEFFREELKRRIAADGIKLELPLVGSATFYATDIDKIFNYIISA